MYVRFVQNVHFGCICPICMHFFEGHILHLRQAIKNPRKSRRMYIKSNIMYIEYNKMLYI